ncbi:PiggyBac transposable element-derived protein 4 [Anthophora plagiata]
MSTLSNEQSAFAEFSKEVHNCELSSDGGSTSNSDAEPEIQDSDSDDPDMVESLVSTGQIVCGRNWQEIAPKSNNNSPKLLPNCSLTRKSEYVENIDECFHLFINDTIMDNIILYTNKRAIESILENKKWKPLDRTELDAFFGLLLLIGRFRESRESKHDLWKENEALSRRFYAAIMSPDRFVNILRYIRFDESTTREERKSSNKLAPLQEITNIFSQNCRDSYNATDFGCVDEQLMTFRGRSFKVYMPNKPGKYGIKIWTLCDSNTFYCCNMEVYLGKHGTAPEKQQGKRVVKQLTDFWKNSVTDNFFTDLSLAEELLENNIFLVGTMRKNKTDLPKTLIDTRNRSQYSSYFLFTVKLTLVSYVPKPRKCVVLLSTLHHEHSISTPAEKFKPDIINYYNSTKSGVDVLDKVVTEYSSRRCTRRWPLSLFMHYLDIAAYNAFIIWQTKYPAWMSENSITKKRKMFLEELARKLTAENINRRANEFENMTTGLHRNVISAIEATGRKIIKKPKLSGQNRARCCFCIGSCYYC